MTKITQAMRLNAKRVSNHRDGSRKSRIHRIFDAKGADVAMRVGKRIGLKDTTLRSWFSQFRSHARVASANEKKAQRARENAVVVNVNNAVDAEHIANVA